MIKALVAIMEHAALWHGGQFATAAAVWLRPTSDQVNYPTHLKYTGIPSVCEQIGRVGKAKAGFH